jgi:arginase
VAIQVLGFPTTLGLPRQARQHGPEALRAAGLIQRLARIDTPVIDLGNLPLAPGQVADPVPVRIHKVVEAAGRQADLWLHHHRPGDLMVTVGGDHTTSLGTIWALSRLGTPFDVVWIDAHGDFNILETSPSGNPHGMVLALACGLMPAYLPRLIPPSALHLLGVRNLDPGERELLARERVEVLTPAETRHEWERVVGRLKPYVFLSFDIDAVDPEEAPGTMTPVPGGFHRHEALELVAYIARRRRLLAVDLVEFHPDLDQTDRTLGLALDLLTAAVSGQVPRCRESGYGAAAAGD